LHEFGRLIGRYMYRPAFRIRVHHIENVPPAGPLVLVANHSTMIEPQLIFGMMPRRSVFLVKGELFKSIAGKGLRAIGQIPIRRGEPDRAPLLAAVGVLKGGGVIGVFPEGTRGEGDVLNAEQGAAWLVRQSAAPAAGRGRAGGSAR
jgi:1-acyl-sn-glycerol-3-phosphate acyltransferase